VIKGTTLPLPYYASNNVHVRPSGFHIHTKSMDIVTGQSLESLIESE
jgi:hypothetical protein